MFDITNKIIFVSLVVILICSAFVYYSMRQRINQTEQNMDTMFNLVSSLNDEQKRLGNLVVYSINQQEAAAKPVPIDGANRNITEDSDQSSLIMQEIENSNLINLNDIGGDDNDDDHDVQVEQPSNMINLLLQGQSDLRVVVSEDEDDDHDQEVEDFVDDNMDESSSDEDDDTVELNKLKVNDLKQMLETLNIPRSDISKARKLKKNELVEFIKQARSKTVAQENVDEGDKSTEQPIVTESINVVVDDENDDENDEILEQGLNLDDDSDLEDNDDAEAVKQPLDQNDPLDEQVVELDDDDFGK